MTGGLIQIVTSGTQDVYLTVNPQITFFKKVFKRHTNFSTELRDLNPEQTVDYNNITSFIISNNGDALHRCYLEVELPNLSFSDKYITNPNYINRKNTEINNLKTSINKWNEYYINLKNYVDIEAELYRNLFILLQTENISINTLKDEVTRFNFKNKSQKDKYKNKIEETIYIKIDISSYITSINKLISNTESNNIYILRQEIIDNINSKYNSMVEYLNYYNLKKVNLQKKLNEKQKDNQINFNYSEYLGHNFFQYFTIEIGGIEVRRYSNDVLHINQMHSIKSDYMDNYLEMIGHTSKLNQFNNEPKGNTKILIPLIFWFNKDAGASLPLVALQYSTITLSAKINELKKIISFENYEKMYDDLLIITVDTPITFTLNQNLIYNSYKINPIEKTIIYYCSTINDELLKLQFPDLSLNERNLILANGTNNQISKYQWFGFMLNINNPIYSTLKAKVGSYYPYIDFNLYYSLIPPPKVKLIGEIVYFDDVERDKFANSKLEYVVEIFDENIFNIKNKDIYDCELSFNNPCKELLWYIQPQIYSDGLTENGQNTSLLFDYNKYFVNHPIKNQQVTFDYLDVLQLNIDDSYYTNLLSYKYLNNILPNGVYYHSFSLYPEESQPSGEINLRMIKGKQYFIEFNKNFLNEYLTFLNTIYTSNTLINNKTGITLKFISKNYDLFVVHKGYGNLLFTG